MLNLRTRNPAPVLFSLAAVLVAACERHDGVWLAKADRAKPATPSTAASDRLEVSGWASHLLMSADAARQAIARGDKSAAASAVDQAISFSDKLGSRATAPIYSELSSVSVIGPVAAAKAQSGNAGARPAAVKAVASGYTRIVLDADLARARLLAAKTELANGDLNRADGDLRAIQSGVVLETVNANLPLVRARENLGLAKTSAQSGKTAAAKSQLVAAQKALSDFASVAPTSPHAGQALTMAGQITSAATAADAAHPISTVQIDQWWSMVADWTDQG